MKKFDVKIEIKAMEFTIEGTAQDIGVVGDIASQQIAGVIQPALSAAMTAAVEKLEEK